MRSKGYYWVKFKPGTIGENGKEIDEWVIAFYNPYNDTDYWCWYICGNYDAFNTDNLEDINENQIKL